MSQISEKSRIRRTEVKLTILGEPSLFTPGQLCAPAPCFRIESKSVLTRGQDGKKFVLTRGQDDFQIGLEGGTLIILVEKNLRNFLREVLPGEISMPSGFATYITSSPAETS